MKAKKTHKNFFDGEFNLPKLEGKVLKFWDTNRIFEKSLEARRQPASPRLRRASKATAGKGKHFVFYEGPPYANGKPGIHHVLARIVKDIILRYKTMRGYFVPRRAGWDTHGLPVEMAAEKALGLKSKRDIEKFGVEKFNKAARDQVWIHKDEWENMTRRIGYWLDLKNAYITYESDYIETIWWTLKKIWERKLLYRGHKVVPWCPRCGTALSSHELAQGYKETTDQSAYLKFHLLPNQKFGGGKYATKDKAYVLSWTTTPWTLPGNVALAVGRDISYSAVRADGAKELLILASDLVEKVFHGHSIETVHRLKGKDLVGLEYEPLFNIKPLKTGKAYRIYQADFVSTEEGTGVVHTAVMYGEDDYELGKKVGLPQRHTVTEDGKFTKDVPGLSGLYVRTLQTEEEIFRQLKKNGYLLKIEKYVHEYPYCWRCETPVLYYARDSWFIAMSKLKNKLLASNKEITWIPEYLKEGRFGEWLREVKDWNLSRERYWGVPLPIWECNKGHREVVGSLDELSKRAGDSTPLATSGARNSYWIMRHGESENLAKKVIDSGQRAYLLTLNGRVQAESSAKKLRQELARGKKKIDLIFSSDVIRVKETAKIAAAILGVKRVAIDKRLHEINLGKLSGCHDSDYHKAFPTYESRFEKRPDGGESLRDLRQRVWKFLSDTEKKYKNKNILLLSHEYPIWMLAHAAEAWSERRAIKEKEKMGGDFVKPAEYRKLSLKVVPRNETGEVDLHRPYADEIKFKCQKCRGEMSRIKEVADVWYDSGAMPFAQFHYPFDCAKNSKFQIPNSKQILNSKSKILNSCLAYPADYIAEGMDQTRGWFYTLLAVATALGYKAPYKNVVSLGLINDKNGQKMSKSKGNIVDPWVVINKYGVDAVRWYFYTVNPPGEAKNFDESEMVKTFRRFHLLLYNSLVFWKTYGDSILKIQDSRFKPANVLDKWILMGFYETLDKVTGKLEKYEIREAALSLESLVDDLSRWYIRRSRPRFQKSESKKDYASASATLGFLLAGIAKLAAPFTPFFAEAIYAEMGSGESVHLADWPKSDSKLETQSSKLISAMAEVRRLASLGLALRAEAGIKVRQPLTELRVKSPAFARPRTGRQDLRIKLSKELLAILAEEVNVKKVVLDPKLKAEVVLDAKITPQLKEEGMLREVARAVQGLRQRAGLRPADKIVLMMELPEEIRGIVSRREKLLKSEVGAKTIEYKKSAKFDAEINTKIEDADVWLAVRKI